MYLRLLNNKSIQNQLSNPKQLVTCLIDSKRNCTSSSESNERKRPSRHVRKYADQLIKEWASNFEGDPNTSKRPRNFDKNRPPSKFKQQKTAWLGNKVDAIKQENEPKEEKKEINELRENYNVTEDNQYEILNRELTPLSLVDYETQLKIKTRRLQIFLDLFKKIIQDYSSTVVLDSEGNPCVVYDIIRSDLVDEYQSQNDFNINFDVNKSLAVGFNFGRFNSGDQVCIRPTKLVVCKKSHRQLAQKFEDYLKEKSRLRVRLDLKSGLGNWTGFFVKSNEKGEHQCVAKLTDDDLTSEQLYAERELLKEYFQPIAEELKIHSFHVNVFNQVHKRSQTELLFGQQFLPVQHKQHTYNIPVNSLFPKNTGTYCKILDSLIDNLDLTRREDILIVNPQSGLCLPELSQQIASLTVLHRLDEQSRYCKKSIEHLLSKYRNIKFKTGSIKTTMFNLLDRTHQHLTVIIQQDDLSFQVTNELRDNENVGRIVMISMKPKEVLLKYWVQLCLSNRTNVGSGNPFTFISATPVDTHPHSNIYTIVSVFERIVT